MSKKDKTLNDDISNDETVENPDMANADQNSKNQSDAEDTTKDKQAEAKEEPNQEDLTPEEKLQQELDAKDDKYLRLFAEFENYKRRTSKERIELFKTASQEVMQAMLPILDDFDRALIEIKKSDDTSLVEGVELINNKLRETLKSKGLEVMTVNPGDAFDSDLHEAITQVPSPDEKMKGKIIDVVEKGYTLGERIIRYPKVVTGK
jgi:molecular chaperone GrpE